MFKIIALIVAIRAAIAKSEIALQDWQSRVAGAVANAAAERIAQASSDRISVTYAAQDDVAQASVDLDRDIKAAYEKHTQTLQAIGTQTDAILAVHAANIKALREKRDRARSYI